MKLNLISIMLVGSGLLLSACGGNGNSNNSSTGSNDEKPIVEKPGDVIPPDEKPGDEKPGDEKPGDEKPGDEKPGDEKPPEDKPNVDVNNIQDPVVGTPSAYQSAAENPPNAADSVVMTYKMKGIKGTETQATALVFTPKTAPPAGGWPIVAWGHGTTGVIDQCAPSRMKLITTTILGVDRSTHDMIDSFVKEGYVVVAPDYDGLGEPGGQEMHPFLHLKSAAYSITDAVVATKSWLGNKVSNKWAVAGVSQGGHAALGAAEYAARANMDYKGAVALAPANNLEMLENITETDLANKTRAEQMMGYPALDALTSFMGAGMKSLYPNEPVYTNIFNDPYHTPAARAEERCLAGVIAAFTDRTNRTEGLFGRLVNFSRRKKAEYKDNPIVRQFLDKDSQPLQTQVKTPIIIYQGGADTIVYPQATDALVEKARALNTKIEYRTDPTWRHVNIQATHVQNGNLLKDIKALLAD
ncbi:MULTISPECIES: alpha/beta hydrolase family protein [Acinetobacter]|uniref:alpha/beta hydrolase family protein n=1 Tax=Acinetobacter TaxID=469 RepID=UPI000CFF55D0|nr:prolyl oligopeptidase family serine peptidase [Acinetobacter sp. MYb10]QLD61059.1 prolyl oligopeptidase family serine peptidase [Acinetobacter sp. MYb10]